MAEEKKRFPWWWLACAAMLLILAVVVGFIERVGREGTLVGRYQQIRDDMSAAEVAEVLGVRPEVRPTAFGGRLLEADMDYVDGPVELVVRFEMTPADHPCDPSELSITRKYLVPRRAEGTRLAWVWWRMRRWAEDVYTAIHGPRR